MKEFLNCLFFEILMRKSNLGILVVHLLEDNLPKLTHESKSVGIGLEKVREVLRAGTEARVPMFLTEGYGRKTTKKIYDGIRIFNPNLISVGLYPFGDNSFNDYIQKRGIQRVILMGFNRVCCVKSAAQDIISRELSFAISDDLLFGNNSTDCWLGFPKEKLETLSFYEKTGTLYSNYLELIRDEFKHF